MVCAMVNEAMAERREREWREAHFEAMTEAAREAHARRCRVYGALSQGAEREAMAGKRLAFIRRKGSELIALAMQWKGQRYHPRTPRSGRSAPDAPYVRVQRYPRQKAIRAWLSILAGGRGSKDEIVTAADRQRRRNQRVAKSLLRVAPALAQNGDGLATLENLIEAIRRRRDGAAA